MTKWVFVTFLLAGWLGRFRFQGFPSLN
jgi:hypothetical protein